MRSLAGTTVFGAISTSSNDQVFLLSTAVSPSRNCPVSATSGVLCVALHRDAAARACTAFRERRAEKAYLAIVEGVVNAAGVPLRREEAIVGWGDGLKPEDDAEPAKTRRAKTNSRALEYLPSHVFFQRQKVRTA